MTKAQTRQRPSILNKRARFEYHLLDRYEVGVALKGTEVKSLRQGQASLDGAYGRVIDNEVWLVGATISPYEAGNLQNHEPMRPRKLLLHRQEIRRIATRVTERGLTLIPTRIYFTDRGLVKVELALGRGKSKSDKREDIKARDHQREMSRATAAQC